MLHRYLDWLETLEGAPSWQHVRFVKQHDAHGSPRPVELAREALLTPEAFESEFERCMQGEDRLSSAHDLMGRAPSGMRSGMRTRRSHAISSSPRSWHLGMGTMRALSPLEARRLCCGR